MATGNEPFVTLDGLRMAKKKMFFTSAKAKRELGYRTRPAGEGLADADRLVPRREDVPVTRRARHRRCRRSRSGSTSCFWRGFFWLPRELPRAAARRCAGRASSPSSRRATRRRRSARRSARSWRQDYRGEFAHRAGRRPQQRRHRAPRARSRGGSGRRQPCRHRRGRARCRAAGPGSSGRSAKASTRSRPRAPRPISCSSPTPTSRMRPTISPSLSRALEDEAARSRLAHGEAALQEIGPSACSFPPSCSSSPCSIRSPGSNDPHEAHGGGGRRLRADAARGLSSHRRLRPDPRRADRRLRPGARGEAKAAARSISA